ncbi:hypothetical protein MY5147_002678 [Beauveria neobassiana]
MASILSTLGLILSKIPLLLKTIVFYLASLSPTARKWDLGTEVAVTMLRDFLGNAPPSTVSAQQALFMRRDTGARGRIWVARATLPAPPEDDVWRQLRDAIAALGTAAAAYEAPPLQDVSGEWVGVRHGVSRWAAEPARVSERDKFARLTAEAQTDVTVLYIHGGANYLMDPVSARPVALTYATHGKCRVFSVRYRLAPQGPFPSALLDVFVAYLSLLYPPPGAWHSPVSASSLIVTGDSAGGNLSTSLLQLLLQLHRAAAAAAAAASPPTVRFHGRDVPVPLPAGVGLNSPSLDLTRSMQWSESFLQYDYLPPPHLSPVTSPPCAVWPADPPRVHLYCEGGALAHPLVSPMAAASWEGAPPVFFVCGEELLADEAKTVACRMARQGVPVVWEQWEAMPHCFSMLLTWTEASRVSYRGWADFVRDAVRGEVQTKGCYVEVKTLKRREVDVKTLTTISDEDVLEGMAAGRKRIEDKFAHLLK